MTDKNYPVVLIPSVNEVSKSIYNGLYFDLLAEGFVPQGREGDNLKLVAFQKGIVPKVPVSTLLTIVNNGGYFKGIKVGLKIDKTKLITKMPKTVEGSTFVDEQEKEVTRTWGEWIEAGNIQPVEKLDSTDKIMKASRNGQTLDSTELDKLSKEVGIEVLDWKGFIDLTNSVDYKEAEEIKK